MSYQEWRRRTVGVLQGEGSAPFWAIIDFNWLPAEQNELARLWKAWAPE